MTLLLTDRSRWARGNHCPRARFLEYHFPVPAGDGASWTGLRPRQQNIPLLSGRLIHRPITDLLALERTPGEDEVRTVIAAAQQRYRLSVSDAGFDEDGITSEMVPFVVAEQCHLLACFTWCFYLDLLPWLLQEFEVLEVEREDGHVATCTCGLGEGIGEPVVHASRGCSGVLLQLRPDFVTCRKSDGSLGVLDLKSGAYEIDRSEVEHSVQMAVGTLGVERRFEQPVHHYYLIGLRKGKRDFLSKWEREQGGQKKQNSVLCYAWLKPGDPPLQKEEWSYEYTSRKGFARVPVWELRDAESWVKGMPEEIRKAQLELVGPCQRDTVLIPGWLRQVAGEEARWASLVEALWNTGEGWGSDSWEALLDEWARQTWDCKRFGRMCEFRAICMKEAGWEDPLGTGRFVPRIGNHEAERAAQEALGLKQGEENE